MCKPIICVDFDGVIHSYENGWQDGKIYGTVVPGFFEWAEEASVIFQLTIFSSRSKNGVQREAMITWLWYRYLEYKGVSFEEGASEEAKALIGVFGDLFVFSEEKPPAFISIDDRAICFKGNWKAPELTVPAMKDFRPWMV